MTILIFDKYFSTLGGGERHIGVVAELLLNKHEVYIIHNGSFHKEDINKKLNLDLSKAHFIDLMCEKNENDKVRKIVKELQPGIFINATHFSQLTIDGIPNITLVFFPKYIYPRPINFKEKIKYKIGKRLFNEYKNKIGFSEFSYEENVNGSLGKWSTGKSYIHINSAFENVSVYYKNLQNGIVKDIVKTIKINEPIKFSIDNEKVSFQYREQTQSKIEMEFLSFVPAKSDPGNPDRRELGLFITHVYIDSFSFLTKLVLKLWRNKRFGNFLTRLYIKSNCIGEQLEYANFLKRNTLILSNSKYTSKWINTLYGKDVKPHILYPPTMTTNALYAKKDKKNYIISVGRFFTGDHSKKQLELIKFFKKLYDKVPVAREYTFHVCGGTHNEERNQRYLDLCYQSSEGYPIKIHPNIRFEDLRELYSESKIFWHGAGLYENQKTSPDKFEHLGFTTIESMISGCVPVVIGVAGQLEVVKDDIDGFLWTTEEEILAKTEKVMSDESLRKRLSAAAIKSADNFNYQHFHDNVVSVFKRVNVEI